MSTLTIELPDSLRRRIETLAAADGLTISQWVASAAGEKLAVTLTADYLRRESARGGRDAFDRYLLAVPDVPPAPGDELPDDGPHARE